MPSLRATSWAIDIISERVSERPLSKSRTPAICSLGMTSTCTGACGLMSRKASAFGDSATTSAGIFLLTIRQKRQSAIYPSILSFFAQNSRTLPENFRRRDADPGQVPRPRPRGTGDGHPDAVVRETPAVLNEDHPHGAGVRGLESGAQALVQTEEGIDP